MKILDMPAHMTDAEYRTLIKKYKDEPMIKVFISTAISKAIKDECYEINRKEMYERVQEQFKPQPLA